MGMAESIRARNGAVLPVVSKVKEPGSTSSITLGEAFQRYEIIDISEDVILAVDPQAGKKLADTSTADMRELGYSGNTMYNAYLREDYNPELRGELGLRKFDQMRRSDAQVRMSLRLVKTPVLAARWYMDAASDSKQDKKIAEFVWENITKKMSASWPQILTEILLCLDFGWYSFEKVFAMEDNKVIWRKLAPRHPMDIANWNYDAKGGPDSISFYLPDGSGTIEIPITKLLVFTHDKEAGNMEGISVLRSAYKHWYLKENMYKIDAIQKERHGIGIPIIKLPPNFSPQDKALANEMGRNLRTNERAHIVLPPMWEVEFAEIRGNAVNLIESIAHHDMMIARNVLGQFINQEGGNTQEDQQTLFLKATRFIADIVRDVFNKWAIPELVNYNWKNVDEYPELKVRRIGDTVDWRTISFAIRNFVGAGIITPDDQLENWVRNEMDLPAADADTARDIFSPQDPADDGEPDAKPGRGTGQPTGGKPDAPVPGLPRQSQAANMQKGPGSNGRVGRDGSRS